jgi:hypothetical protein
MRLSPFSLSRRAVVAPLLLLSALLISAPRAAAQDAGKTTTPPPQQQPPGPKLSGDEAKLAQKIEAATDAPGRLAAAEEFLKKYPKSAVRAQLATFLADQISALKDNAQVLALGERYMALFPEPAETVHFAPAMVEAYAAAQRFDDAFRVGAASLAVSPDDARVLSLLAFHGIQQARSNNPKFAQQSQTYLPKAVALFEAGTKPAGVADVQFDAYKKAWLPQLYQLQGVVALSTGDTAGAIARAQKALALSQSDPMNFYIIGVAKNEEYQKMAAQYQPMAEGPQKTELRGKIDAKIDEIIDYYARVVALTADAPQHKALHDGVLADMTSYYKFRHNGSTDGMQAIIDKHKKPAPPQP